MWDWYHEVSDGLRRVEDGVCFPIPFSEYLAWAEVAGVIVTVREYAILRAVDAAFCIEMNKELQAFRDREQDRFRAEIEAARTGRG